MRFPRGKYRQINKKSVTASLACALVLAIPQHAAASGGSPDGGTPARNRSLVLDATSTVTEAAGNARPDITPGLRAADGSDAYGREKPGTGPAALSTGHNAVPDVPTGLDTSPSSGGCPASGPFVSIGNTDVTLNAKVVDPDGGTLNARFDLWATGRHPDEDPDGVLIVSARVSATSGTVASLRVPKDTLRQYLTAADGNFSWRVRAEDSTSQSAWAPAADGPGCRFVFDPDRPSAPPTVKSTDFPDASGGRPQETGEVRKPGTFIVGDGGVDDVTSYEYWTDWATAPRSVAPTADLDGDGRKDGEITLVPPTAGPHTLNVRSLDAAGNRSDLTPYRFWVDGPAAPDGPGDLDGDGIADLYGVRANGELVLHPGQGDGRVGAATVAASTNFDGATLTHRGDWTGDGYEDLIAALPGDDGGKSLYLFPNNGTGYACTSPGEQATEQSPPCTEGAQRLQVFDGRNNHWAAADQILAIGDVDGPQDIDGDGTADVPGFPDLLVKEGNRLWLYFGSPAHYLDMDRDPVLLGEGPWADYDLVAPGDRTGNGHVDLIARDRNTGQLRLFEGTGYSGEGLGSESASVVLDTGWTPADRPLLTAAPDAGGGSAAGLWATGDDDRLRFYPDVPGSGVTVEGPLGLQALS
ncbi:FG-GAP-like repeat-containing protein [Streptomyces pulveraceus]|uniref:FG-GAP-like repeat-containing protein n=1 Tax=Streptomyces pulveraceus TaxID=68258 RepID=A0ABW1GPF3_9ACTN